MPFLKLKAHDYYFAFAEVEYSEKSAKMEATLTLTAHDFEVYLQKNNVITNSLDIAFRDENELISIQKNINSHFFFFEETADKKSNWTSTFKIDGHQILLNGNIEIYLSCEVAKPLSLLNVQFNLLIDYFSEQQNKITFIHRRKKSTLNFNLTNQSQIIDLN
ncbi:MAG: DUF6702 family protein [Bacteroidota bacterium]